MLTKGGIQIHNPYRRLVKKQEAIVRYLNAEEVLPAELLAQVQQYADGIYLYIPRRADHRKNWGSSTRYREELQQRNESIRFLHGEGLGTEALAERFHLSVKTIQRVLRQK